MTLGSKIQMLRKRQGMSQEKLADELGVSRQAVSKWELDAALPDIANVVALSRMFSVTTDYLLKDDADDEPGTETNNRALSGKRLAGFICGVSSAACLFITYIISRFVPVMTPIRYYNNGKWMTSWHPDHTEVSFRYFVSEYKLQLLLVLFGLLALAGIVMVFEKKIRLLWMKIKAPFTKEGK